MFDRIIKLSIGNPVFVNLAFILVVVAGLIAAINLPREEFPEISLDRVVATVVYPGVLAVPITTVNTAHAAAYGAALLASVGGGHQASVGEACAAWVRDTETTMPGADRDRYASLLAIHQSLYPALRDAFTRLHEI